MSRLLFILLLLLLTLKLKQTKTSPRMTASKGGQVVIPEEALCSPSAILLIHRHYSILVMVHLGLDAINFTSARYKSSEIKLVPDTQDIIVGVVVEGDRQSDTKKSSSTRTYRTTSHVGTTSRQSQNRYDERGDRYRRSHGGGGVVDDIAVEIEPDRPLASRDTRIEIDENFSIASTRRSESSDEDLYDYGDIDRRLDKTVQGHVSQNDGQSHRTATMDQREMLRRQAIEKRSDGITGSVAMNASGAEKAKTLGDGRKSPSRFAKSGNNDVRHHNGHDYHVAKREVVNGKEFITLVRAEQPTKFKTGRGDQARSKSTRYVSRSSTTLPRSFSETTLDPRTRVSFRDPIESASDTNSIPTIGVIHLVDAIQEEPIARVSSGVRGRTKDRYQKKRLQRSRSESPIKYSERINSESQELHQKHLSSASRTREHQLRSRSTTPSGKEIETSATSASHEDVPTIGVVRLVSPSPHSLQNSVETSTSSTAGWPRLRESRSPTIRSASTEISQRDNDRSQHTYTKSANKREMFLSMVNASTQCSGPKLRVATTEPRISWRSLLEEMEEKLTSDMLAERKSKSGKKKSTLSRLTSYRKNKKETSKNKPTKRSLHDRDDLSWDGLSYELQGGAESPDDRYFSEPEREMVHIYRSSSAQSRGLSSTYSDKRRSQSKTERNRRSRSVSPGHSTRSGDERISVKDKFTEPEVSWETLIQNVRMRIRTEDGRRGRSPVRRSKSDRELYHGVVDMGTQSDVSWDTLLRLMEARIEERVTKEQRYKKRSVPLVGKFSLKAEKKPQKTVAHMGTSPELSWGEFVDIATLEAERNMKSKSVPDLREEISPQNIGVFSLKEKKDTKAPVRSTGTETDLSFSDLIDIVMEEINLTNKERSKYQRSISYDREMLIDRAKSLGIVQLRSKSEERVRRRDTGTQPDLSWAQLIDIVTDEARKMLIRRQTEISSEMGTDPIITWRHLVETIHEESGDFWRRKQRHSSVERSTEPDLSWHQLVDIIQEQTTIANRKQTTSRGIQPKWSWTEIVNVIQEETEEILRLKTLSNMTSKATTANFATPSHMQGTQTDNDKTSVAVSTLRTWVRDRPRRVQWEDATEPEIEWDRLVREIEGAAIDEYIRAHGLDQPREAPVVSVFKLKKTQVETPKITTSDAATSPVLDWRLFINEVQEDAVESYKSHRKQQDTIQRVPVAGVFKLKQEEKPRVEKHDTGTDPAFSWKNITEEIETSAIESYRRTRKSEKPTSMGVIKLKSTEKEKEKDDNFTQSDEKWSDIITDLREEFENEYRKTIRQLQSKLVDLEDVPKSLGVLTLKGPEGPSLIDTGTQPEWTWDVIINGVQEETEESIIRQQRRQRQRHLDSMLTTSVQVDVETVDAGIGDDVISKEDDFVEVRNASSQVSIRYLDKSSETVLSVSESGVQVIARTTDVGTSACQSTTDTGNDAIFFQMPSVGITCAPEMVDTHVTAQEQSMEVTSTAIQTTPQYSSIGITTIPFQVESKSTQCKHDVKDVSVEVTRSMANGFQQTQVGTTNVSLMTDIQRNVKQQGVQISSDCVTQSSQTEICTYDSSVMTDPLEEVQEVTIVAEVEQRSEASHEEQQVEQEVQATQDTFETWTFTDVAKFSDQETEVYISEFDDYDEKVVSTALFAQQIGDVNTHEISTVASPDTASVCTETVMGDMESKHVQTLIDYVSRGSIAVPETSDFPTQTSEIEQNHFSGSFVPSMVEESIQSVQEMSEFSQHMQLFSSDRECQVAPEVPTYKNEGSMAKPEMNTLGTECYVSDDESDTDSGIDIDCQTHPVLVFSMEEFEQIKIEMNEYRQMQERMKELKERLKEFEDMALLKDNLEQVDIGIGTDCQEFENDATQTILSPVKVESSQTATVDLTDRSSSPINHEVRETVIQTIPLQTKDISTEVDEGTSQNQSVQTTANFRNVGTDTDNVENHSTPIQATVHSQQASCQYDRNDQDIGIQVGINVKSVHEGSQVDVIMKSSATSTGITETNASTQSSPIVRDNNSQYESSENHRGSQTLVKQLVEKSTETQAEFVPMQATVESQQASCQYDRNDQDIGVQVEISKDSVHQGSQVDVIMKSSATSTEITETNASTQSSPIVRDNDSQYESSEKHQGSQTVVKELVETSTETQAVEKTSVDLVDAVVHTETSESTSNVTQTEVHIRDSSSQVEHPENSSSTQTDEIDVKDEMLDPIVVLTTDAYVQANRPVKDSLCSITQTEENKPELRDTATSSDLSVSDAQIQTTLVTKESASSQAQQEMFSSLTQTDQEEKVKVVDSSTWMDLSYQSFNGQTDPPSRENQGVQYQSASHDTESQTSPVLTLENAVNTISKESTDNSSQTFEAKQVDLVTRDTELQHSPEVDDCSSQTLHMSMKHSFTETDEKVLSDQMVGTNEINLKDTGSQADVSVCSQLSQSEICMRAMESQTAVVTTAETGTSFASLVTMNDNSSQYDIKLGATTETQTDVLSTSDVSTLYELSSHTDGTTQYEGHADDRGVQTEPKTVAFKQTSTEELILTIKETQTEKEKKVDVTDHVAQTFVEKNDVGVTVNIENEKSDTGVQVYAETQDKEFSCDFKEIEYIAVEKEVEIKEASVLHQQSSSTFHNQFDELKMPQEETGTIVRPDSSVIGYQFNPETSIFSIGTVVQTNDIGTSFETVYQNEISSQVTPDAHIKSTQVQTTTTQRSLSPLPIPTLFASTQISLQPVHTTTLQIQVNEGSEAYTEDNIEENVISVVDGTTQTNVSSIVTTTQTVPEKTVMQLPSRVDTMVDVRQDNRQRSFEFHPVQHSRGTATYNSIRKEMGTQFITREVVRKSHSRRDVALTSAGTFMDLTTRTTSSTQTMRTRWLTWCPGHPLTLQSGYTLI
ncbi:hypothetical protein BSL78_22658 [Apostichopus japonicus]|uniref:Uncharacterized protein n=1 Tax=Stichopus japonicus TaxID=307972 RepID=A0A2G8JXL2_STIJA|nr:hypothetical protein BSL78_22658 [Apostichopus japonicus]